MRKKRLFLCMLAVMTALSMAACHKKGSKINTLEYSDIIGAAQGTVSFDSDGKLEINIRDIQSYLGVDIDYSSAVEVENADQFEDFQMWVDATGVDIYTVGKYVATYKFIYDGQETEKNVGVTILEKESSGEDSNVSGGSSGNGSSDNGNSGNGTNVSGNGTSAGNNVGGNGNSSAGNTAGNTSNNSGDGNEYWYPDDSDSGNSDAGSDGNSSNPDNSAAQGGNSDGSAGNNGNAGQSDGNANGGNQNGGSNNGGQNPPREIITSSQSATKKPSTIGYTNIELLSGKYVKLKCTSAKYIVLTRTDESDAEKNGKTYHVSKLIITYNTGDEQVLETVEKAVS